MHQQGGTLAAHDITIHRGADAILERVSLTVTPGSRIGVVGPISCGPKSPCSIHSRAATGSPPGEARTLLAKFDLYASHVLRPAGKLSPGERTRAELAVQAARGAGCLVLDEPTNHLDLPAVEELERALAAFDGTLILVTHDRRFLERVGVTRVVDLSSEVPARGRPRARRRPRGRR